MRTIVDHAFGTGDRGLDLVGHNEKNHLFESRLSYYSDPGAWDVTSGQAAHPEEPVGALPLARDRDPLPGVLIDLEPMLHRRRQEARLRHLPQPSS